MKKLIPTLVLIGGLSALGHVSSLIGAYERMTMRDNCAKEHNVYACKLEAVPTEAPRVEYRQAAILPPPVM
jgi:hypothetical protein